MIQVNEKNLLAFVSAFFISMGCDPVEVNKFFTARKFSDGIVLNLPAVCLLTANKPATSKSKQSHIHVTAKACEFFYPAALLSSITSSTNWEEQPLGISEENINYLLGRVMTGHINDVDSHLMMKVECRKSQEKQVQLSKIKNGDDEKFLMLRQGLYENDVLVFLRYRNSDKVFVIGVPNAFYKDDYEFESRSSGSRAFKGKRFKSLESENAVPVNSALKSLLSDDDSEVIDGEDTLEDAVYQNLVDAAEASHTSYTPEEYDEEKDSRKTSSGNRPSTNPSLGKEAIKDNGYCCAIDPAHTTFIKTDGTKYMEAHHLIPMRLQRAFKNKLDTKANISPVCPVCHRKLHYGRLADVEPMLKTLYAKQEKYLKLCGIDVKDFDELKSFYK